MPSIKTLFLLILSLSLIICQNANKTEKKENILLEIVSKASNNNINVESINTYNNEDDILFELTILVENTDVLEKFMSNVKNIPACITVERGIM